MLGLQLELGLGLGLRLGLGLTTRLKYACITIRTKWFERNEDASRHVANAVERVCIAEKLKRFRDI